MNSDISTHLKDLSIHSKGYIVGYDKAFRGYIGRLLKLGLAPETEFTVILHHFPQPHFHVIEVDNQLIQLTPPEANALCVESSDLFETD
ncbi:MAG: FeoA family protein [Microcystaceae cyanobacterium]